MGVTLQEFEAYIAQLVPNLRLLQFMDPSFLSLYCRIAARKFLFFCDPQRRGRKSSSFFFFFSINNYLSKLYLESVWREQLLGEGNEENEI